MTKSSSLPAKLAAACILALGMTSIVRAYAGRAEPESHQLTDPVIEEPLRPLLPEGQGVEPVAPASCGTPDIVPLGALSVLGLQFISTRRRRTRCPSSPSGSKPWT